MTLLWRTKRRPEFSNEEIRAVCDELGSVFRVRLSGRITIDSTPGLRTLFLDRLGSPNCQTLTVDCSEVSYVDTSGLAMWLETLRAARIRGKAFQLSGLRERPRFLLESTRLLHLFDESALPPIANSPPGHPL